MQHDSSEVTSIVVNYFCARLTARAVESVQADMPGSRVIVVDNSADETETAILKLAIEGKGELIVNQHNIGFGAACNQAFQASASTYVMLLNPDARMVPGCLAGLASALNANPKLGAVGPQQWWEPGGDWLLPPAWLPTGIGMWSLERACRSRRWAATLSRAYRNLALNVWQPRAAVIPQRALSGGAMMVRRAAAESAGGLFDPAYFMYYEDSDLCLRLRRAGWVLGNVPHVAALHEWEHSNLKVGLMEVSKAIYLQKNFEGKGDWSQRLDRCTNQPGHALPLEQTKLNTLPAALDVPPPIRGNWLLEVSPSPLMVPAIGHLGHGNSVALPASLLSRLGNGPAYFRLGAAHVDAQPVVQFFSPVASESV